MKTTVKDSKIRLIVNNLCEQNFELIKNLSNTIYVEGIAIIKR